MNSNIESEQTIQKDSPSEKLIDSYSPIDLTYAGSGFASLLSGLTTRERKNLMQRIKRASLSDEERKKVNELQRLRRTMISNEERERRNEKSRTKRSSLSFDERNKKQRLRRSLMSKEERRRQSEMQRLRRLYQTAEQRIKDNERARLKRSAKSNGKSKERKGQIVKKEISKHERINNTTRSMRAKKFAEESEKQKQEDPKEQES